MTNKRYVCVQACQLGGKRYEVGEELADGVEPNSHFKDTKTGEMVKKRQPEPSAVMAVESQAAAEVKEQFEAFKVLVGEHLAKFDKRITALEKATAAAKKAKGGNKETPSETQEDTSVKEAPSAEDNDTADAPSSDALQNN